MSLISGQNALEIAAQHSCYVQEDALKLQELCLVRKVSHFFYKYVGQLLEQLGMDDALLKQLSHRCGYCEKALGWARQDSSRPREMYQCGGVRPSDGFKQMLGEMPRHEKECHLSWLSSTLGVMALMDNTAEWQFLWIRPTEFDVYNVEPCSQELTQWIKRLIALSPILWDNLACLRQMTTFTPVPQLATVHQTLKAKAGAKEQGLTVIRHYVEDGARLMRLNMALAHNAIGSDMFTARRLFAEAVVLHREAVELAQPLTSRVVYVSLALTSSQIMAIKWLKTFYIPGFLVGDVDDPLTNQAWVYSYPSKEKSPRDFYLSKPRKPWEITACKLTQACNVILEISMDAAAVVYSEKEGRLKAILPSGCRFTCEKVEKLESNPIRIQLTHLTGEEQESRESRWLDSDLMMRAYKKTSGVFMIDGALLLTSKNRAQFFPGPLTGQTYELVTEVRRSFKKWWREIRPADCTWKDARPQLKGATHVKDDLVYVWYRDRAGCVRLSELIPGENITDMRFNAEKQTLEYGDQKEVDPDQLRLALLRRSVIATRVSASRRGLAWNLGIVFGDNKCGLVDLMEITEEDVSRKIKDLPKDVFKEKVRLGRDNTVVYWDHDYYDFKNPEFLIGTRRRVFVAERIQIDLAQLRRDVERQERENGHWGYEYP